MYTDIVRQLIYYLYMNPERMVLKSKRKLFWVGILFCFISPPVPGIVYGIALATDKESRRDGLIVLTWAIVWYAITFAAVAWLVAHGYLPIRVR